MTFPLGAPLLDACVLAVLEKEDAYGYSLTQRMKEVVELSESTLYPVLRRLQQSGCLTVYDKPFQGRNRRYYAITPAGRALLAGYRALGDQMGLRRLPRLVLCPSLPAPMLAGLLRPVILLPEPLPQSAPLECALRHELTHFRRRDIWLKALALWVNALHWFNPLAWYMVRLVERDTELACDEAALNTLSPEEHAAYGQTILSAVSRLRKEAP